MNVNGTELQKQAIPRPEHPRPDFERNDWLNLNGTWGFAFDDEEAGLRERWFAEEVAPTAKHGAKSQFDREIIVPFCYQSKASGIGDEAMHDVMWYRRNFDPPASFAGKRVFVNFGAVDYEASVWVNGIAVGSHRGGHSPFAIDISDALKSAGNSITVRSEDRYDCHQPRGKQIWKDGPERCWYRATSGIWQTVWLEAVGVTSLKRARLSGDAVRQAMDLEIQLEGLLPGTVAVGSTEIELAVRISFLGKIVRENAFLLTERVSNISIDLKNGQFYDALQFWSPEHPNLYDVEMELRKGGELCDKVKSYFGLRTIAVRGDLILLNGTPLRQKLVLDQGYWPDTLLTPPSDAAIVRDIELAKSFGFNGARKHQKIEDPRFYYHADRLGFLVWGELPSAYDFSSRSAEDLMREMTEFISRDFNHPSIIVWVPLNESWGTPSILKDPIQQSFSLALYHWIKTLDPTRLVSANDGWEQTFTDICGIHDYEPSGERFLEKARDRDTMLSGACASRLVYANGYAYRGEPIMVTEFGGTAFRDDRERHWGYFGAVADEEEFIKRLEGMVRAFKSLPWIRGFCYTQLTDVFQEINGLLTMNREPKVASATVKEIIDRA
ncbi:MAG: sugar-binding domain-containing protein [Rectinemataceae bacterium]